MQAIGGAGFVGVASAAAPSTTAAPAGNAPIGGSAGEATQNVAEASLDLGTLAGQASGGPFAAQSPLQPGIQYEDALAHEHDPNTFQPGGRVTVPFRPRTSDGWAVNGRRPVALPAGRLSGRVMVGAPEASQASDAPPAAADANGSNGPDASVSPNPTSDAPPADPAAWV